MIRTNDDGSVVIDEFTNENGRTFTAAVLGCGRLQITSKRNAFDAPVEFTDHDAERAGIMLCRFLEHCRQKRDAELECERKLTALREQEAREFQQAVKKSKALDTKRKDVK